LIKSCLQALENKLPGPSPVDPRFAPLLKRALISSRRVVATRRDEHRDRTLDPDLHAKLDARVEPLDRLMAKAGIVDVQPIDIPHLIDYLNIGAIEERQGAFQLAPRVYDEKFHVLQSPRLFLPDLQHYRLLCDMRGKSLTVAFLDIDDFKTFNTEFGEVVVDRNLLARFMMEMEAHVFSRGLAYRFAGDEYVVLLPNFNRNESVAILRDFQERLVGVQYTGISRNPTVSVGLCVIDQNCFLTDTEILEAANRGKDHAKRLGKNRIAEALGPSFGPCDVQIVE